MDCNVEHTVIQFFVQPYGMKKFLLAGALSLMTLCFTALAQSLPVLREQGGLTASARVDGTQLKLRVLDNGSMYSGIVHSYFVRKDFAYLYFQYPSEGETGVYSLEMPAMEPGSYELILEITGGNGHEHENPRFVQVFGMDVKGVAPNGAPNSMLEKVRQLELQATTPVLKPAGQVSSFDLTTLLAGKPVAWNPYETHQFAIKTDWSYFKHDHPDVDEIGVGSVRSKFKFPTSGEYVIFQFLETGVQVAGEKLRPTLRLPGVLRIP
jgi:hypothetical protein